MLYERKLKASDLKMKQILADVTHTHWKPMELPVVIYEDIVQ